MRILVLGYVVRGPIGGMAWHHLHYVAGLAQLGHDVYFVEDSDDYPSCYDPTIHTTTTDPTYGLEFARECFDDLGLTDRWAFYDAHADRWHGPMGDRALALASSADLLINVSGVNPVREWMTEVPVRVFIDTDPVFTQIRHVSDPAFHRRVLSHNRFFTFGVNLAIDGHFTASGEVSWESTRQPIVLDKWEPSVGRPQSRLTTVMQWDSYPAATFEGRTYGMKSASFEQYVELPRTTTELLEIALGGTDAPRDRLTEAGWLLRDPLEVTRDLWSYQRYIQESKAELSVAKHGYVSTRCGWFSERSANYLASGRPVVVEETGFSDWMQTGMGVLPFTDIEQASAALADLGDRYDAHCHAARNLAEEHFDARKVLTELIDRST